MRRSAHERGAILLYVSFLVLVLMGLAALVIDLGIARSTQLFMQASADSAALEGLRLRDSVPADPAQSDLNRRQAAARAARLVFSENLGPVQPDPELLLGAGPRFETGVGGVDHPAGGLLVDRGPYLPALQLNAGNARHGDLVAGNFTPTDPLDPGNPRWHDEAGDYGRSDFAPAAASPGASAFLARLRRTHNNGGLDREPGISSTGPTLPFLFGLGSGVLGAEDPAVYDPRRDGLTIRATSIADARPALAVGLFDGQVNGLAPVGRDAAATSTPRCLAFEDRTWRLVLQVDAPFEVTIKENGAITDRGPTPTIACVAQPVASILRVGDPALLQLSPGSMIPGTTAGLVGVRYVALYASGFAGGRITGFAAVRIDAALAGDQDGNRFLSITGVKLASQVAPENASSVPSAATDLSALFPDDPTREPLLAPVLAR